MILNATLPYDPRVRPRLPGTRPLGDAPVFVTCDAHAAQMAKRDALLKGSRDTVLGLTPGAEAAAEELLAFVLDHLPDGARRDGESVIRADGVRVDLNADVPLATALRLVQEDLCLMEKRAGDDEHVLTVAALCFPSQWRLHDKLGRPLIAIHEPVEEYDSAVAPRVQRLFDGVRAGQAIWRQNELWTDVPELHRPQKVPRSEKWLIEEAPYLRSERQVILRLPETRAVLFAFHTFLIRREAFEAQWGPRATVEA